MTAEQRNRGYAIAELVGLGLSEDEAVLVADHRMSRGGLAVGDELVAEPASETLSDPRPHSVWVLVVCALLAGIAMKLLASNMDDFLFDNGAPVMRNLASVTLPFLALTLLYRREFKWLPVLAWGLIPYVVLVALGNGYQFVGEHYTVHLQIAAMPIALWLLVGVAYVAGEVGSLAKWLRFLRFSGEWFIFALLLWNGVMLVLGVTGMSMSVIGAENMGEIILEWLVPIFSGITIVVAGWLADSRRRFIGSILELLGKIFTPVTALAIAWILVTFLLALVEPDRDLMIAADAILVLVVALVLYTVVSRDEDSKPGFFDYSTFALILLVLIWDLIALGWMVARVGEYGFTANRMAALSLNLIFLVNLVWSLWLSAKFLLGHRPITKLAKWQAGFVWPYFAWAAMIVLVFPLAFRFH